jgi:hypothetical protein
MINSMKRKTMTASKDEIKVIAQEVAERYFGIMKEYVAKEVQLHTANCTAGKLHKMTNFISGIIGGGIVAAFNWFLKSKGGP